MDIDYKKWIKRCYEVAACSPDTSTQIGALLLTHKGVWFPDSTCCNKTVKYWPLQEGDLERPRKYAIIEHAERRAIFAAAKLGFPCGGATMVSTWAACTECARAIVESGIKTLVRHVPPRDEATERWLESIALGDEIMKVAGVNLIDVEGPIPGAPKVLRGGVYFDPTEGES